jgi:hypothetical protein
VVLELSGLTGLTLSAAALPGGEADWLELVGGEGQTIEVTIANICDENPLFWPRSAPVPKPDDDFRWHYELLVNTQKDEIDRRRRGASLPFPIPEMSRVGSAATGVNCFPARFAAIATGF